MTAAHRSTVLMIPTVKGALLYTIQSPLQRERLINDIHTYDLSAFFSVVSNRSESYIHAYIHPSPLRFRELGARNFLHLRFPRYVPDPVAFVLREEFHLRRPAVALHGAAVQDVEIFERGVDEVEWAALVKDRLAVHHTWRGHITLCTGICCR